MVSIAHKKREENARMMRLEEHGIGGQTAIVWLVVVHTRRHCMKVLVVSQTALSSIASTELLEISFHVGT